MSAYMPAKRNLESLLKDKALVKEMRLKTESDRPFPRTEQWSVRNDTLRAVIAADVPSPESFATRPYSEAIILAFGRPALLVKNDSFEVPESDEWKARLYPTKSNVEKAIRSVGRIELMDHPTYDWVGTGWMIAENIIVTNRHVAMLFAEKKRNEFVFSVTPENRQIRARIDFKEEYRQNAIFEAEVEKVIFIEEFSSTAPDIAFLQLKKSSKLPPPILIRSADSRPEYVAAIGYPARDPRNEEDALFKVFGDVYNVKRLSPGCITAMVESDNFFTHDCSTLGGNSGSAVIDIGTGEAVGLHFGGMFQHANYAVKSSVIYKKLADLNIQIPVPELPSEALPAGIEEATLPAEHYDGLKGYKPNFLGSTFEVALPKYANGQKLSPVLKYTHFSLQTNLERKMAAYTAVNVNGKRLLWLARNGEKWYTDPRTNAQTDPGLYSNNDLDRGHLVRRLDPVWGSEEEANRANEDTFHYTNACPQHKDFNQKTWNELEDYVLDNAGAHDLKLTVFTGPVFRDDDREYRGYKLPRDFWKVVAMVRTQDGAKELSATAYLLSQANLLTDLEFAFGEFKTYQVPVSHIEKITGLDFGTLREHDPKEGIEESVSAFMELKHITDIKF